MLCLAAMERCPTTTSEDKKYSIHSQYPSPLSPNRKRSSASPPSLRVFGNRTGDSGDSRKLLSDGLCAGPRESSSHALARNPDASRSTANALRRIAIAMAASARTARTSRTHLPTPNLRSRRFETCLSTLLDLGERECMEAWSMLTS